ncbi:unnamed protein product [Toxocara canis]|uniref:Transmembrane 9 superfamily member n=1 Tax=Toxocara canis TaxID=6265 RepID=A0A183VHH4_TOXCA|nr:unnamed protein product [Toxocara canis]
MLKNVLRETIRQEEDKKAFFSPQTIRIQWMAVLNSALLVVLLVRRDLNRYNDAKDDELLLENGWKTISMDVFRTPKHAGLFAAILGKICIFFGQCIYSILFTRIGQVNCPISCI